MLWFINLLICIVGLRSAHRAKSVLVIFWAYGAYIGLLGLLKFALGALPVTRPDAEPDAGKLAYLLFSNILFLVTCELVWRLAPTRWRLDKNEATSASSSLLAVYIVIYCAGLLLYARSAIQLDYHSFVNYEGSAWAQVTFYCGATLIAVVAARKRWLLAVTLCAPYVLLSSLLGIRSFLALSIFPVLVLLTTVGDGSDSGPPRSRRRLTIRLPRLSILLGSLLVAGAMAYAVVGAALSKHGEVSLPEEQLIEFYFIVTERLDSEANPTGTESVERFFTGLGGPILKELGIRYDRRGDPQTIFASYLLEDIRRLDQVFHYPSLWQADTYAAHRSWGLLLAPFWAVVLIALERLVRSSPATWLLFLPVSCWIVFMFARGAVGNSTISMSYVIWVQLILLGVGRFLAFRPRALAR